MPSYTGHHENTEIIQDFKGNSGVDVAPGLHVGDESRSIAKGLAAKMGELLSKISLIDPQVRIGHVHLKVADLERSLRFYCGVLGFQLTQRYGTQAAFVSAGGYHHHIGLEHLGEPGRVAPASRHHGALPRRHPLSDPEVAG